MRCAFRYFSNVAYQDNFLNQGEIYFNSLAYFLSCEDNARRDTNEGTSVFQPLQGLEVNNLTRGSKFKIMAPMNSSAQNLNRVFVYCLSLSKSSILFDQFKSQSCVCINDLDEFQNRIVRQLIGPLRRIHRNSIHVGHVNYYDPNEPPGTRWALPERIVMSKTNSYASESEYRIAFALDRDTFKFENVEIQLGQKSMPKGAVFAHRKIFVGSVRDICTVHNRDE